MTWLRIDNKREKMAAVITRCGLLKLLEITKQRLHRLTVLAYHRILDITLSEYPFDEGVISTSSQAFDRQMNFVSKNFDVITFTNLKDCLEGDIPLPKRPLVITFDDGYADNYFNAFQILKKYHLPATIFVSTGYIGTCEPFWFEKVVFWVKRTQNIAIVLKRLGISVGDGDRVTSRQFLNFLKNAEDSVRLQIIEECEKEGFLMPSEREINLVRPLSWDEIREMSVWGIEFGSHSVSHPILSRVSDEKLQHELVESKKKIEYETGKKVVAVAYPVGKKGALSERVVNVARALGYTFGITYEEGIDLLETVDRYRVRRIAVEHEDSFNLFRSHLLFPRLFFRA